MQPEGNEPGHGNAEGENGADGEAAVGHLSGGPVVPRGPLAGLVYRDNSVDG